jgi:hypothetical protein
MAGAAVQPTLECAVHPARRQAAPSPRREGASVPHDRVELAQSCGAEARPRTGRCWSGCRRPFLAGVAGTDSHGLMDPPKNGYLPEINEPLASSPFGPGRPAALLHLFPSSCSLARRAEERCFLSAASASPVTHRDLGFAPSGQGNIRRPDRACMRHHAPLMRHRRRIVFSQMPDGRPGFPPAFEEHPHGHQSRRHARRPSQRRQGLSGRARLPFALRTAHQGPSWEPAKRRLVGWTERRGPQPLSGPGAGSRGRQSAEGKTRSTRNASRRDLRAERFVIVGECAKYRSNPKPAEILTNRCPRRPRMDPRRRWRARPHARPPGTHATAPCEKPIGPKACRKADERARAVERRTRASPDGGMPPRRGRRQAP